MRMKKIRLFISIELSEEVRKEIERFVKKLKRRHWPVRWVAVENIHITLAFLGWQEQKLKIKNEKLKTHIKNERTEFEDSIRALDLIVGCLEKAVEGVEAFEVKIRGIGCFPEFKRPRVVWLGLAGELKSLAWLQKQVNQELEKAGFKIEERKFIPHLTLGRVERGVRARALHNLGDQISRMKVGEFGSKILVEKISVMESKLKREGPEYRELASVKLKE